MTGEFARKVVIITGSSSGIGQAAAVLFAKDGASVTIHGRSTKGLQDTVKMMEKAGGSSKNILAIEGNIEDEKVQKTLIQKTVEKFGKLDILVNNAGIAQKTDDLSKFREMENFDYVFNVNLRAPVAITELAIPHLEKTKGNIINISSVGGQKTVLYAPFYAMAKCALDHFCRNYAALLAPKGIRINNLCPGGTDTNFSTRGKITGEYYQKLKENLISQIPMGRFASSEEMAEFIYFMASDKAAYMTGQLVSVDGGSLISVSVSPFKQM